MLLKSLAISPRIAWTSLASSMGVCNLGVVTSLRSGTVGLFRTVSGEAVNAAAEIQLVNFGH